MMGSTQLFYIFDIQSNYEKIQVDKKDILSSS